MATTRRLQLELRKNQMVINNKTDGVKRYWVSFDIIQNLIGDVEVEKILQETKKVKDEATTWTPAHIKRLKEFVFEKALRLFALLVSQSHVQLLELFYRSDFGDDMFPIEHVESTYQDPPGWTIESKRTGKKVTYEGWEVGDLSIETIYRLWQWQFFVPVFKESDPVHEFSPLCQMPFLREEGTDKKNITNFSVVRHFVIHRSHLSFSNIGQIVRNDFVYYPIPHLASAMLTYIGRYG
jgi:hypothetical protein